MDTEKRTVTWKFYGLNHVVLCDCCWHKPVPQAIKTLVMTGIYFQLVSLDYRSQERIRNYACPAGLATDCCFMVFVVSVSSCALLAGKS